MNHSAGTHRLQDTGHRSERCPLPHTRPSKTLLAGLGSVICGLMFASQAFAAVLEIPLELDYRIVEQALVEQMFSGPGHTAEVFADSTGCNRMVLSEPRATGADDGRLRLLTSFDAQTGTPLAGRCLLAKSWQGLIETLQTAGTDPQSSMVSFTIVESTILRAADQREVLPGFLKTWIQRYVHPRLGAVTVDLQPAVSGLREILESVIGDGRAEPHSGQAAPFSTLQLTDVRPAAAGMIAVLALEVEDAAADWQPPVAPVWTEAELAQWDSAWQAWDGFATWLIKTLAVSAESASLSQALAETLLEARYELRDALARDERDRDPVRALFLHTWSRLAPLLHDVQLAVPGSRALPYATFISAGNALQTMDQLAPHLGLRLDSHSLRNLARVLVPAVSDYDLRYDTSVDPELRQLLGLDPELPAEAENTDDPLAFLSWFIATAQAAQIDPELLRRLDGWIPQRREVDDYLGRIEQLLAAIARAERDQGKVPAAYLDLYQALLRATAWQESCWRQYIERDGVVQAIRSSAGSVGLMQINVHVWRGVYDRDALNTRIGYNARAGNEILVHYLVDYAIRKKEYAATDEPDNLARATYAVYNGGPRHLSRYRDPDTSTTLKKIDEAFWQKFQTIRNEGPGAVKACLTG